MILLNGTKITQGNFPDGTLLVKYTEDYFASDNVIEWKYENDSELFTLICLVNHIKDHKQDTFFTLTLPYLPHARMDRVKNDKDVFTLKYFCQTINSLNFERVIVNDVHSNVGLALLDRVSEIKPTYKILDAMNLIPDENPLIVFYPDEGAMKRYSGSISVPFAFGVKQRNWETGEIEGLMLQGKEGIAGKDVLIIDDICSRGGTFYHSALALKEAGAANIYLYVTHCENTIHEGELLKDNGLIERIYTTDSLLTKYHDKITIV